MTTAIKTESMKTTNDYDANFVIADDTSTTFGAASSEKVGIITTHGFQWHAHSTLLTHRGLVMPFGNMNLGQHWLR